MPSLSSHTSAAARRWSSSACAAIRARASASVSPRCVHEAAHPGRLVGVDHDDEVVVGTEALLDEQRHVVHDDRVRRGAAR